MKKLLLIVLSCFAVGANAQTTVFSSNFENWNGNAPTDWLGSKSSAGIADSISQSTDALNGAFAVKMKNCTTSHRRLTTKYVAVTGGQSYSVSFFVKGQGEIRVGIFDSSNVSTTSGYHYASSTYFAINSSSYAQYSQNITANITTNAQFILSFRSSCGANPLIVDSVVIKTAAATSASIYDIQYTTGTSSPLNGQTVATGGIVTGKYTGTNGGYFIQNGRGPWKGINVVDAANSVAIGDSVTFTGTVTENFGNTELTGVTNFVKVSSGNTVPASDTITTSTVNTEQYEGVLVTVTNATAFRKNTFGEWVVWNNSQSDTTMVDDKMFAFTPSIGTAYNVTGPVFFSYGRARIEPRMASDVTIFTGVNELSKNSTSVYPNPASSGDLIRIDGAKTGNTLRVVDVTGKTVLNTMITGSSFELPSLESGVYFVTVINGNEQTVSRLIVK